MTQKTARDFSRTQIKEIAEDYAYSSIKRTASYYAAEYGISECTFYTLMEKAVVEGIVSSKIVDLMQAKAMANAKIKAGAPGKKRSWKHYELLKARRETYCFSSKKKLKQITTDFVNSDLSLTDFAKQNCMTVDLLKRTIDTSIDMNLLSSDVLSLLIEKRK